MKKSVRDKDVVRTHEVARARRAARVAKARSGRAALSSRTAQTTLAAAIGAGILLHGGQQAPLSSPPVALVVQDVAWTSSGDDDGSPAEQGTGATDANSADAGSTSDVESESAEDADPTPESTAPVAESAEAPRSSDDSAAPPSDDSTSPTTQVPSTSEAVPVTTTPKAAAPTPVSAPAVTPSRPTAGAEASLTGRPGEAVSAPVVAPARVVGTPTDAAAIVTTARDVAGAARTATRTRVTQAVAQNLLARIALGLAGILPTAPSGNGPIPTTPAAPTGALLIAQWALFRRGGHVFNQSPVSSPAQAPSSTGAVAGNLHATDPDGDRLTYTVVTEPTHGRVTVGADGAFTYTPDPEFARTGGSDAFTVVIRDNDPATPGAGRYTDLLRQALTRHPVLAARLFGPHAISVTVPVTVAPTAPTPPVSPAPVVERGTGAVTGRLDVPVTPGVPLELSVPQQPSAGAVTVQPNGTYTFTPNAAARRVAAGTPGSDVVRFTVLVADGQGGTTPVEVTAVVDPGPAEVVAEIPVGPGVQQLETSPDGRRVFAIGGGGGTSARTVAAMRTMSSNEDAATAADAAPAATSTISIIDSGSNTLISTIVLPGNVENLMFSPDGTHAFLTTRVHDREHGYQEPSTITVIDTASDAVVGTIVAEDSYGDFYFAPDGKHAYLSDYGGDRITVLDLATNATTTISVPSPQYLTFSPDGRRAYMPNIVNGTTTVIDTTTNTVLGDVPGYGGLWVGPDERHVYIVDSQQTAGSVTVIDSLDDSVTIIPVGAQASPPWFGAGGAYAFVMDQSGPDPKVTVIDTSDHSFSTIDLGSQPGWMYVSPDGSRTYVTDRLDGTVTVIDSAHGVAVKTVQTSSGRFGYGSDPQFSPDGTRFYLLDGSTISVFNTVDDSVITIPGDGTLGFTPDGSHAYVLGRGDLSSSTLRLIDTSDDSVRTLEVPGYADRAYFNQDGSRAYLTSYSGKDLTIVDTVSGDATPLHVGRQDYEPQFSPDGRQLFVVGSEYTEAPGRWVGLPGTVTVIDTVDDTVRTVPVGVWPNRMTFSPDGVHAYVVSDRSLDGSTITVIDRTDGTYTSFEGSPYATDVEFTPDGRYAYVFGYGETIDDGEIMFIDLADGAMSVVPVPAPTGIRFSADGRSAYVLDSRAGTATVIALDGEAPTGPESGA